VTTIAVVDHGAGNLVSIAQGLRRSQARVIVTRNPADLEQADGVVLPGVGSTAAVMNGIDAAGFRPALRSLEVPLLGICVGMQVLFDTSEEDGADCLGLITGTVRRLTNAPRLPHIGWNDLTIDRPDPLLADLTHDATVYFVHSFAPVPEDPSVVVARTNYGDDIVAAVRALDVAGVQFHPERSGENGLAILAAFVDQCEAANRAA